MQRVPCLFWQEATVIALRHDGKKIKTERERDNCQSSIFDLFDFYVLKCCFCLFAITSIRWREWIGPSCLYSRNQSPCCNDGMTRFYQIHLCSCSCWQFSLFHRVKYTTSVLAEDARQVQPFSCCSAICSSFGPTPK